MLHACFVRSPFARARIVGIDASAALALAGVHAVFVAADLNPDVREPWYTIIGQDVPDTPRPPLAEGEVRFVGDPVALVVAENRYLAEDAAELVDVDYDPLPAVADYADARRSRPSSCTRAIAGNVAGSCAGAPAETRWTRRARRPPTSSRETIYQQAYAAVPHRDPRPGRRVVGRAS